jgi:preprotein translocase subunit SecG
MATVLIVIHLLIAIVMIGLILMQKSEGAAGAGFSGAPEMTGLNRPSARPNPLSRATTVLGICFFATSLGLALLAKPADPTAGSIFAPQIDGPAVPKVNESAVPAATSGAPETTPAPAATPESAPPAVPSVPNN